MRPMHRVFFVLRKSQAHSIIVFAGCPRVSAFNLSRTIIEAAPSFRGVCEKVGFVVVSLLPPGEPRWMSVSTPIAVQIHPKSSGLPARRDEGKILLLNTSL